MGDLPLHLWAICRYMSGCVKCNIVAEKYIAQRVVYGLPPAGAQSGARTPADQGLYSSAKNAECCICRNFAHI